MIKHNFLFNVATKVRWNDDAIETINLLVEANNESEAEKIAEEELLNENNWKVKEIIWQELAPSNYYLSK